MAKNPEKLVILDGMALFYRAYHAIPHLSNADGMATNAIFGFASMVLKAIADIKPDYLILAWDKSKTSLSQRLKIYPEYKAKRLKMGDDFYAQIPYAHTIAERMGIPVLELDHYEADDIIGTLSKQYIDKQIIIVSNDRDIYQLLDPHVEIYRQLRGMTETEIFDAAKLEEKYGLKPAQIIDLKSLEGDASDNIPGIAGVGEKTALGLLEKYHDLDGIYDHIDEIPGKLHDRLVEGKQMAYLSRRLATIMTDAPVKLDLESARLGNYDRQGVYDLFRQLGFKSLLTKIPDEPGMGSSLAEPTLFDEPGRKVERLHLESAKYLCIDDEAKLTQLAKDLSAQKMFAFDTETDSLDIMTAKLVGMSFCWQEGEAFYVPLGHQEGQQMETVAVLSVLKPIFENPKIGKVGHNIKFDYQLLKRAGINITPIAFDTMIAAFIVNPLVRSRTLDDLAYSELGIDMIPIDELIVTKGKSSVTFETVAIDVACTYACEDADVTWRLYEKLAPQLTGKLKSLAEQTEWPLIPVLGDMELAGIELNQKFLAEFNKSISAQILKLEDEISQHAGERFNISSPAQLSRILYEKLELEKAGIRRGKTGISTAATELEKMRDVHPIVELILQYRELVKLKTTYIDALPKMVSEVDGRIHTSYSQTIAQTGRLSSNNPNLQNIPVRTELGREIRKAFVAPKGRVLVSADYSQIELRIAAALSKDQDMIKAFKEGIDIHQRTAAELYGVPLDKVTKDQRYNAKTVNFGVLYGMSPHGLSVATGMERDQAAEFINRYYELRPKLREYIDKIKADARKDEYVETLLGRRRPCGEINSNNFNISAAAERMAVNVPIQGTAADIMKLAMIQLAPNLDDDVQLLLQIHDELIVEAPKARAEDVAKVMKQTLEQAYDLGVPIEVDTRIGSNWGTLE